MYTDIAHLSDLTSIVSLSAPDLMHWVMGLGQYTGICDAWPELSSSDICSASLHGLLQPGALTLLTRISVLLCCLFFYLYCLTSNIILAYSWSETTHETATRQHSKAQGLSHFIVFCCRLANWLYSLSLHLTMQITLRVYAHPYNGSYCCFKKHINRSVKFQVFCFC